jgi:ornithine carbamoyltransferase
MAPPPPSFACPPWSAPSPAAASLAAARVRQLRTAAQAGRLHPVLKGRKLGLLCDEPAQAETLVVFRAAAELGAHVSLVRPGLDEHSDGATLAHTARTLGRLYDAVACLHLPPALVDELRAAAGIPVIDDAGVAALDTPPTADADERRYLWQAAFAVCLG